MKNTPLLLLTLIFSLLIVPTTYAASGGDGDLKISDSYDKEKAESEAKAKAESEAKAKAESEAKAKAESEAKAKAESEAKAKAESEAKAKKEAEVKAKAESVATAKAAAEAKAKKEAEVKAKAESVATAKAAAEAKAKVAEAIQVEKEKKTKEQQQVKEKEPLKKEQSKDKSQSKDNKSVDKDIESKSNQQGATLIQVDVNSLRNVNSGEIKLSAEAQQRLEEEGERRQNEQREAETRAADGITQEGERQGNQDETQDEIDERLREQREQQSQERQDRQGAREDAETASDLAAPLEERVRERREREATANALEERQAQIEQARTVAQEQRENYIRTLMSSREFYTQEESRHRDTWGRISTELHRIERLDANNQRQMLLRAFREAENAAITAGISAFDVANTYSALIGRLSENQIQNAITTAENRVRAMQRRYTLTALRDLESAIRNMVAAARDANTMSAEDANEEINNNLRERYQSVAWGEDGAEGRRRSAQNQYNDANTAERNANEALEESQRAREDQENDTPEERERAAEEQRIVDEARILLDYSNRIIAIDSMERADLAALQRNPFGEGEQGLASVLREQAFVEWREYDESNQGTENERLRDDAITFITSAHNAFRENWDNAQATIPEVCSSHFEVLDISTCVSSVFSQEEEAIDQVALRARWLVIRDQLEGMNYEVIRELLLSLNSRLVDGNMNYDYYERERNTLQVRVPEPCRTGSAVLLQYYCEERILYLEGGWGAGPGSAAAMRVIHNRLQRMRYSSIRQQLLSIKSEFLGGFASTNLEGLLRLNNSAYLSRRSEINDEWTRLWREGNIRYESLLREQPQYTGYQIETIRIQDAADDQRTEALRVRGVALAALEEN